MDTPETLTVTVKIELDEIDSIIRQILGHLLSCPYLEPKDRANILGTLLFFSAPEDYEKLEQMYD